ncbi:MAG: hypothetical protein AAGK47_03530 [Bacteroidota bacterium]
MSKLAKFDDAALTAAQQNDTQGSWGLVSGIIRKVYSVKKSLYRPHGYNKGYGKGYGYGHGKHHGGVCRW